MPYTKKQCAKFGAMAARGEKVPDDWKEHCTKTEQQKAEKMYPSTKKKEK